MPNVDDISNRILVDEKATVAFGGELYDIIRKLCGESAVVYLHGDLGAGKDDVGSWNTAVDEPQRGGEEPYLHAARAVSNGQR